jgi:hypothetical protein
MNSEEEIFGKLLGTIENSQNEEEIEIAVKAFAEANANFNNDVGYLVNNQSVNGNNFNVYNKLTKVLKDNQNEFNHLILNDSELIIKLFCNVREITENLNKNKRGIDAITNQTLM